MSDTKRAELWYPRSDGREKYIEIELVDVRASDGIRVSYDFERDGWVIEQQAYERGDGESNAIEGDWAEVAFVKSWGRER